MWNPIKAFKQLISKLKGNQSTPPPRASDRVKEIEIQKILTKYLIDGDYPHLFKYKNDIKYWMDLVTAVIFAESNYNRFEYYMEPAPLNYPSLGLLQLSYVDQKQYTFCDIQGDKIFLADNNIHCGLGILNILVGKYGNPISNKSRYWSVLNNTKKRHKTFLAKFNELQRMN